MTKRIRLLFALLLALGPGLAWAQMPITSNYTRAIGATAGSAPILQAFGTDTNISIAITPKGSGNVTSAASFIGAAKTDIVQFYPATTFCQTDVAPSTAANLIPTRLASNDWARARTAVGAETYNIRCDLPAPWRTTSGTGYKLASFRIAQQITVAALTSNTFNALSTTTYVNNVADAVATYGGAATITMPTATQANPYLTAGSLATPAFQNTADVSVGVDFTVVMQNTGVYRLYGVSVTWTQQD